ncbi:unnamed protein product [Heterobilharzia americana]|nr:unnamed protein product [Heterobilharzia americana]
MILTLQCAVSAMPIGAIVQSTLFDQIPRCLKESCVIYFTRNITHFSCSAYSFRKSILTIRFLHHMLSIIQHMFAMMHFSVFWIV